MDLLSDHLEYASANSKGVTGNSTTANIKKEEHLRERGLYAMAVVYHWMQKVGSLSF
jgi:hypothetical protein